MKYLSLVALAAAALLSVHATAQEPEAQIPPAASETVPETGPQNPFGCDKPPLPNRSPDYLDCKLDVGMSKKEVKKILGAPFMSAKGMGTDTVNHYWCATAGNEKVRCVVIFDKKTGAFKWRTYLQE